MSLPLVIHETAPEKSEAASARIFAAVTLSLAAAAAILAGWLPLGFSIVTVFLFAGPHNWLEARYFLTRMPARWGRLRGFFMLAFAGVFSLTAAFACLLWLGERGTLDPETWVYGYALLSTALVLWVALLVHLRSRQNPRRDWAWVWPVAFALIAVAWLVPPQ